MKYISSIFLFLLLTGTSLPSFATEQSFTYCYNCTEAVKKHKAKSILGSSNDKKVTVINYFTLELDTYYVTKIEEPGLYQVLAHKIVTDLETKNTILNAINFIDSLKVGPLEPFNVNILPNHLLTAFPFTAHDLVGPGNNTRNLLRTSISEWISSNAEESFWGHVTFELREGIRAFTQSELLGIQIKFEFIDGSHVTFIIKSISNGYGGSGLVIEVEQKPNSMFDAHGNTLPDDTNELTQNAYNLGGPGDINISLWMSMISRLNSFGSINISCNWDSPNHVQCENL